MRYLPLLIIAIICVALFLKSAPEPPTEYSIPNFPLVAQDDHISCGPAAAKMVLQFYGKNVSLEEIRKVAYTTWHRNANHVIGLTIPTNLRNALECHGVHCWLKVGSIRELKVAVSQGKPVIVLLRSGERLWHYVVVVGYNPAGIIVADPGGGIRYEISEAVFVAAWNWDADMRGNQVSVIYKRLLELTDTHVQTMIVPELTEQYLEPWR